MGFFSSCFGGGSKGGAAAAVAAADSTAHEAKLLDDRHTVAATGSKKASSSIFPHGWGLGDYDEILINALANCDSEVSVSAQAVGLNALRLLASKFVFQNAKDLLITQSLIDQVIRKPRILERLRLEKKTMAIIRQAASMDTDHDSVEDEEDDVVAIPMENDPSFELFLTLLGQAFSHSGFHSVEGICRDFGFNSSYFSEGVVHSSELSKQQEGQKAQEDRRLKEEREREELERQQREEDTRSRFESQLQKKTAEIEALKKENQRISEEEKRKRAEVEMTWQQQLESEHHQASLDKQEALESVIEGFRKNEEVLRSEFEARESNLRQALQAVQQEIETMRGVASQREAMLRQEFQEREEKKRHDAEEAERRAVERRARLEEEKRHIARLEEEKRHIARQEEEERKKKAAREEEERKNQARLKEAEEKRLRELANTKPQPAVTIPSPIKIAQPSPSQATPFSQPTSPASQTGLNSPHKSAQSVFAAAAFASMLQPEPFQSRSPMVSTQPFGSPSASTPVSNLDFSIFESPSKAAVPSPQKLNSPSHPPAVVSPRTLNPPPTALSLSLNAAHPSASFAFDPPSASSPASEFIPDDYSDGYGRTISLTDSDSMISFGSAGGRGGSHQPTGSSAKKATGPKYSKIGSS